MIRPRAFRSFPAPAPAPVWMGAGGQHASRPILAGTGPAWRGPGDGDAGRRVDIGETVNVPQIRTSWGRRTWWTPIRGEGHEDYTIFGFPHWHWHIDLRFAEPALHKEIEGAANAVFGQIDEITVIAASVRPTLARGQKLRNDKLWRYYMPSIGGQPQRYCQGYYLAEHAVDTWQRIAPLRCLRAEQPPCDSQHGPDWRKLQEHYAGKPWDPTMRCPHRGASLNGICPDAEGMIHCPLHRLVINPNAGRIATLAEIGKPPTTHPLQHLPA